MSELLTFNGRFLLTRVECSTCLWVSESGDRSWTEHAGWVHAEVLCPGHVVHVTVRDGVRCGS